MKKLIDKILGLAAVTALFCSCSSLEPWSEINVELPYDDYYTVTTAELTATSADGITTITEGLLEYTLGFTDPDGKDMGKLIFVAGSNITSFDGTYTVGTGNTSGTLRATSYLVSGTSKNYITSGSAVIAENGLHSLTVTVGTNKAFSFAKGSGVKAHTRAANTTCTKQYLVNHTSQTGAETYVHTLSLGAKGVGCTAGAMTDTYNGTGDYVILKFVSNKAALGAGTYTVAPAATAAAGNFIAGYTGSYGTYTWPDGSQYCTINDGTVQSTKYITGGRIEIAVADAEKETFTINGLFVFEDGTIFTTSYTGRVTPAPVTGPTKLYGIYSISQGTVMNASWQTVAGVMSYTTTVTGLDGKVVAQFAPILATGSTSLAGSFTVKEYAQEAGTSMSNGTDLTAYGMGIIGSYVVINGTTYLISGTAANVITITAVGTGYRFTGSNIAVKDLSGNESTVDIDVTACAATTAYTSVASASTSSTAAPYTYSVKLLTDGLSAVYNPATYTYTYTGSGSVVSMDFLCSTASLEAGTYTMTTFTNTGEAGKFIAGYDSILLGWGFSLGIWGTTLTPVTGGAAGAVTAISDGQITVGLTGSTYTIKAVLLSESEVYGVAFTGTL